MNDKNYLKLCYRILVIMEIIAIFQQLITSGWGGKGLADKIKVTSGRLRCAHKVVSQIKMGLFSLKMEGGGVGGGSPGPLP